VRSPLWTRIEGCVCRVLWWWLASALSSRLTTTDSAIRYSTSLPPHPVTLLTCCASPWQFNQINFLTCSFLLLNPAQQVTKWMQRTKLMANKIMDLWHNLGWYNACSLNSLIFDKERRKKRSAGMVWLYLYHNQLIEWKLGNNNIVIILNLQHFVNQYLIEMVLVV